MPRYFMRGTRLGGLERMMMDSSRSASERPDPQKTPQKEAPCDQTTAPSLTEKKDMESGI